MDIQTLPIDLSQKAMVEKIRESCANDLSANTFNSLYLWRFQMGLSIYAENDFFAVKCKERGDNAWFFPCGNEEKSQNLLRKE